jgi:hypothetical protein
VGLINTEISLTETLITHKKQTEYICLGFEVTRFLSNFNQEVMPPDIINDSL